ncbi:MAG: hypothetical protein OEM05_01750 [Myxococcales bacterium]|nr:hypothetical protein [Myxococcales bacterium]
MPWVLLFALGASFSLQRIRTFDYWWHLRTGRLIAETGAVPRVDPYAYTVPGAPWVDIHWLHQLGLHALYSLGGHAAVVWAKVALVFALLAILGTIGYRRERPTVTAFALTGMLLVACDRFMPRPELPTFVCLAAVLALLDRYARRGDVWVYAIVAVQLVWVNVHGLFALGIAVCAIQLVAELLQPLVAPGERLRRDRVQRLAAVTALAALAAFANPNFIDGALYPIQQLGMVGPPDERGTFGSIVAELIPPLGGDQPLNAFAVGLLAGLAVCSFGAMALNWRRIHASDPLLWVTFLYLGLGAKRNLALFAIVAAPILVRNWNEVLDARPFAPRLRRAAAALVALGMAFLIVDVTQQRFFPRIGVLREPGFGPMTTLFPIEQAEWIARHRPLGPIAHHMADGGYLIWRLWPDYSVMTDGRLEVFGPEKFVALQVGVSERFRALDREYHFGAVLVHYSLVVSDAMLWWLYLNSNRKLVSVDDTAALFVRVRDGEASAAPEVDVDAPDLFPPLDETRPADARMRIQARTNFYNALHRTDRALAIWEDGIRRHPQLAEQRTVHAMLLYKAGFGAAAEAILQSLLDERPGDALLHTQVGDLRLESGDREAARTLYDRALALDPKLFYALHQRALLAELDGDPEQAVGLYLRVLGAAHPAHPVALRARMRLQDLGGVGEGGVAK